ncbi:TetR/AcrR family transcriptional regulator [Pimelobacter simplex]|uniref:TetR/AcrR family transcriptional regulator n=1 Tax=Nocardioides simplex TaxID=2045 RepID=A0A7J5E0N8_NOCSI|nr:TetR/AcrR family transcriptional regulator [Pimelobacter simplex]KAB2811841.1 TetR/AcrR family transcriptional regulator [Pimelobacter simplex]
MSDEERLWARMVDRRSVNRGDQRRAALLDALDELLREQTLEEINVAEISRRAGVTRSAFYFYFESKATAVLALMAELYDDASDATDLLVKAEGEPRDRIHQVVAMLFDSVDRTPHTYRALLEARAASAAVRELWDAGRAEFAEMTAEMIERERTSGRAPAGVDAHVLAAVLLDLNDHAVERHVLGVAPEREAHIDAITHIWIQSIYGSPA